MRIFKIRGGKYIGEYKIYDSVKEFREKNPDTKLYEWGSSDPDEIEINGKLLVDDGYVTEVLNKRELKSAGQRAFFFRVPMGTFPVKQRKNGSWYWTNLYAQYTRADKSRGNGTKSKGTSLGKAKFAALIVSNVQPIQAYRIAFNDLSLYPPYRIKAKIVELLEDEYVRRHIMKALEPLKNSIEQKYGAKYLDNELESYMKSVKKGTPAHLSGIKFIIDLHKELRDKKVNEAEDADFIDKPPMEDED